MDFSLASRLMHDLRLPSERVYSKVANRLAREYQHDWLRKLLTNLRATIDGRAESEVRRSEKKKRQITVYDRRRAYLYMIISFDKYSLHKVRILELSL
jgi:hypothetical protein